MRSIASLLLFVCLAFMASAVQFSQKDRMNQFKSFVNKYNKRYTSAEYLNRFQIFSRNLERIAALNREHENEGYSGRFGVNEFTDLSPKEFSMMKKGYKPSKPIDAEVWEDPNTIAAPLPTSFDWRTKGAVSPVKNQGDCGSCWAFSTTEGVESAYFLAKNTLPILAPQQIVDCAPGPACQGCGGGDVPPALNYVISTGGMEPEKDYPYTGENGKCKFNKADVVATAKNWKYATRTANETAMQVASLQNGPLSICVDAASWQNYNSGVIKHTCGAALDHCVQIVGWGVATPSPSSSTGSTTSTGTTPTSPSPSPIPSPPPTTDDKLAAGASPIPYWIVRNSWGTDWGLKGYLWVERGNNECGIAKEAVFVIG